MKTFLKTIRILLLVLFGAALTIALSALFGMATAPADGIHLQTLTATPLPATLAEPTPIPLSPEEIGSTDGIMVMSGIMIAIVLLGILVRRMRPLRQI